MLASESFGPDQGGVSPPVEETIDSGVERVGLFGTGTGVGSTDGSTDGSTVSSLTGIGALLADC